LAIKKNTTKVSDGGGGGVKEARKIKEVSPKRNKGENKGRRGYHRNKEERAIHKKDYVE